MNEVVVNVDVYSEHLSIALSTIAWECVDSESEESFDEESDDSVE